MGKGIIGYTNYVFGDVQGYLLCSTVVGGGQQSKVVPIITRVNPAFMIRRTGVKGVACFPLLARKKAGTDRLSNQISQCQCLLKPENISILLNTF